MKVQNRAVDAYQRANVNGAGAAKKTASVDKTGVEQAAKKPAPQSEATNVSFSKEARTLASATQTEGGIDTAKVDGLKAKIADGSFKVDSQAVANGLLDELG